MKESGSKSSAPSELPRATVWTDRERQRFFLIGDDVAPPPGDFEIRTPRRTARVDAQALAAFEVTRERAHAWLVDNLDGAIATISNGAQAAAAKLNEAAEQLHVENQARLREIGEALKKAFADRRKDPD
jgi:hypothetical protein